MRTRLMNVSQRLARIRSRNRADAVQAAICASS
jgi:hypothetical protein